MSINNLTMTGRLTRDVEVKFLPSGLPVAEFGLACNDVWYDKDGKKNEDVCFIECTCFGKRGEAIGKYLSKGDPIAIVGKVKFYTWQSPDGHKRSKHTIRVESFEFMGGKSESRGGYQQDDSPVPPDDIPF